MLRPIAIVPVSTAAASCFQRGLGPVPCDFNFDRASLGHTSFGPITVVQLLAQASCFLTRILNPRRGQRNVLPASAVSHAGRDRNPRTDRRLTGGRVLYVRRAPCTVKSLLRMALRACSATSTFGLSVSQLLVANNRSSRGCLTRESRVSIL